MPEWTSHIRARLSALHLHPTREAEIVEELSQHLELEYEELRRGGASDEDARRLAMDELLGAEALARVHAAAAPGQRTRAAPTRSSPALAAPRSRPGPALRPGHAPSSTRLRRWRRPHPGARHRRQQRHLRAGRCHAPPAAADSRARTRGDDLGAHRRVRARARLPEQPARFRRARPQLRRHWRLHGRCGRNGDGRRRRHGGNRLAPVGDGRRVRCARHPAHRRSHALSRR